MGRAGVNVDRHVERLGAIEDRPKPFVVDEQALGETVDHGAFEAEVLDRAFELVGGLLGIGRRQGGKGGKPIGLRFHRFRQSVIDASGDRRRFRPIKGLSARRAVGDHLKVDTSRVHFGNTALPQVLQAVARLAGTLPESQAGLHLGVQIMFLDSDHPRRFTEIHSNFPPPIDVPEMGLADEASVPP